MKASVLAVASLGSWLVACSEEGAGGTSNDGVSNDGGSDDGGSAGAEGGHGRIAVTADFLARSLSVMDYDALVNGAQTRDEALLDTIDLSAYSPGPLETELTPDGETALVSVSPGFFDGVVGGLAGIDGVPSEAGTFLFVDLDSRSVTELDVGPKPMGIAVSPDGATAYVACFGSDHVAIVDVASRAVRDRVVVGGGPEQIALDASGELGAVNAASDGTVRVFRTADPAGSLSVPVAVSGDPSGVAFVEGTSLLVVANSLNQPNYTVLDVSDPATPVLVEQSEPTGGVPYGATAIPGTKKVVLSITQFASQKLLSLDFATTPAKTVELAAPVRGFILGFAVGPDGTRGLSGVAGDNRLLVIDLDQSTARAIPWLAAEGPTYVAIAR